MGRVRGQACWRWLLKSPLGAGTAWWITTLLTISRGAKMQRFLGTSAAANGRVSAGANFWKFHTSSHHSDARFRGVCSPKGWEQGEIAGAQCVLAFTQPHP